MRSSAQHRHSQKLPTFLKTTTLQRCKLTWRRSGCFTYIVSISSFLFLSLVVTELKITMLQLGLAMLETLLFHHTANQPTRLETDYSASTLYNQKCQGSKPEIDHQTGGYSNNCRDTLSYRNRLLCACARTEHPKLFGLVRPCDSVDFLPLRPYLVKHAHCKIIHQNWQYYTIIIR